MPWPASTRAKAGCLSVATFVMAGVAWAGDGPRAASASASAPAATSAMSAMSASIATSAPAPFQIVGDAIPRPLTTEPGDAARGRAIVANRQLGLCLLCHTGPFPEERFQGDLAPDLAGAGKRWSEGQLRLRLVDARRVNPSSLMPAYFRSEGLVQVGPAFRDKNLLSAQQLEDVVAFLRTLRE